VFPSHIIAEPTFFILFNLPPRRSVKHFARTIFHLGEHHFSSWLSTYGKATMDKTCRAQKDKWIKITFFRLLSA
jgi:hypothetical protein